MYQAKILADSVAPSGNRLTTFEIVIPRFVLAEFNTHRMLSKNAASSRAIPVEKMIERVLKDPAMPVYWGKNQKGMQAAEELGDVPMEICKQEWLCARDVAVSAARELIGNGLHKQIANRVLEPFMWITVIVSATEYANFFHLRCNPEAQPEIRHIAEMMRELYLNNEPKQLKEGEWHLPLIFPEDKDGSGNDLCKVAIGRCARVSYLTHDGKRDLEADVALCDRLETSGHFSPFEHVAQALSEPTRHGNFTGWMQYRKTLPNENYTGAVTI